MKDIVIFGAGGFARESAYIIEKINKGNPSYHLLGFIVDQEYYQENMVVNGYPVVGTKDWLLQRKDTVSCFCAVGEPEPRQHIQEELENCGVRFESLISPDVDIHYTTKVGAGSFIASGCSLTVNITIGKGVVINQSTSIGHDVTIGDYTCIMGNCSVNGWSNVGSKVMIGGAAYILPRINVGDSAVIAAGSVVFGRVKAGSHVIGNPARKIKL